jgi:hypothetical protein
LLQVHHLSGDELCDGEPDDVRGAVDVGDDAPDFAAREPAWFGGKALTRFRCCRSCRRRRWMATRVQPVLASQSSNGRVFLEARQG